MNKIRRVVIHHSASPLSTTMEQIREYHLSKGWSDIAYHFVIGANGFLRHGRLLPTMGAHAKGANSDSIGVCLIGDNTKPDQMWTDAQHITFRRLKASLDMIWPGLTYHGHCEVGKTKTECPGLDVHAELGV